MTNRLWLIVALSCLSPLVAGCRRSLDPPVETGRAQEVMQAALDSWKQGDEYGSLQKRTPPVYFREPEWEAGKKLVEFTIGTVDLLGRQGRCSVNLSLKDQDGKVTQREISYLVDTTPQVVIVRENLGP